MIEKHPAYSQLPITSLVGDFGAVDFIPHLTNFLRHLPQTSHTTAKAPSLTTDLPGYKCLTVQLQPAPQVMKHVTNDVIRAHQVVPAHGLTAAVLVQFNTVLVRESDSEEMIEHPLDGESLFYLQHAK